MTWKKGEFKAAMDELQREIHYPPNRRMTDEELRKYAIEEGKNNENKLK
jgi:hypothetical protein